MPPPRVCTTMVTRQSKPRATESSSVTTACSSRENAPTGCARAIRAPSGGVISDPLPAFERLAQLGRHARRLGAQECHVAVGRQEAHALADVFHLPGQIPIAADARYLAVRDGRLDHAVERRQGLGVSE